MKSKLHLIVLDFLVSCHKKASQIMTIFQTNPYPLKSLLSQTICLFFSIHFLSAQAPDVLWARNIGGNGPDNALCIAVDQNGNVYTTGAFLSFVDFDPGEGEYILNGGLGWNGYILKTDSDGNFLWAVSIGAADDDWGSSIALDGVGGVYITGGFRGTVDFDPGVDTFKLTSYGSPNSYILKLDEHGSFIWAKAIVGEGQVFTQHITIDPSEPRDIYLTGHFTGQVDFNPGTDSFQLSSQGSIDVFVTRMDHSGNLIWAKRLGSTGGEYAGKSAIDPVSKIIYTTGSFAGTVDFDSGIDLFELTSEGQGDVFVISLEHNGDLNWVKSIGGDGEERSYSIAINHKGSGEVYVTGSFQEIVDFDPDEFANYHLTSDGVEDAFILKLDNTGQFIWTKAFTGLLKQEGVDLVLDPSGNGDVYATGDYRGLTDFDPSGSEENFISRGFGDIYLINLDGSGNLKWVKGMGGPTLDHSYTMAQDGDSHLFVAGSFYGTEISFDHITLPNNGFDTITTDAFFVKFDMLISSLDNPLLSEINIFPNPVANELTIEFDENTPADIQVTLYNRLGQIVFSEVYKHMEHKKTINISEITPGIYFVELNIDGSRVMKKVVKE